VSLQDQYGVHDDVRGVNSGSRIDRGEEIDEPIEIR
jgi:hypothetical protein